MKKRKMVLLYDCPIWNCDKIWLYDELRNYDPDIIVADTKAKLSELFVSGPAGRIQAYFMMFGQIMKCLKYRKNENVTYIVWKRNSAVLLNELFLLLRIQAQIVSFNWLTPNEHSRLKYLIKRCLFNRNFFMIVNLKENIARYQKIYGLPNSDHILFLPDVYDTKTGFLENNEEAVKSNYFFTGGMSNRDFRLILEIAPRFPEFRFVIVALREQWKFLDKEIPDNVVTHFNTTQETYYDLMKGARAVILPLVDERVAGLINICKSFQFGIPCIISKTPATELYYQSKEKYLFGIGDAEALIQKINRIVYLDRETYFAEVKTQQNYIKETFSPGEVVRMLVNHLDRCR